MASVLYAAPPQPAGGRFTFHLSASRVPFDEIAPFAGSALDNTTTAAAMASVLLVVNQPPSGGTLVLDYTAPAVSLRTHVVIRSIGWVDSDMPLSFAFSYCPAAEAAAVTAAAVKAGAGLAVSACGDPTSRVSLSSQSAGSSIEWLPPEGNWTIVVECADALGARSAASHSIHVARSSEPMDPAASAALLEAVDAYSGEGDVSSALRMVGSLAVAFKGQGQPPPGSPEAVSGAPATTAAVSSGALEANATAELRQARRFRGQLVTAQLNLTSRAADEPVLIQQAASALAAIAAADCDLSTLDQGQRLLAGLLEGGATSSAATQTGATAGSGLGAVATSAACLQTVRRRLCSRPSQVS